MRHLFTGIRVVAPVVAVVACALLLTGVCAAEEPARVWKGQWNNRKYGTSGPLLCTATTDGKGKWKGVFTGKFQGDPFRYEAQFQSRTVRNQTQLAGAATIRGHGYKWQGAMQGNMLRGKYTSTIGYFGEFVLKEKVQKKSP